MEDLSHSRVLQRHQQRVAVLNGTAFQLVKQGCLLLTSEVGVNLFLLLLNFVFLDDKRHCLQLNHVMAAADYSHEEKNGRESGFHNAVSWEKLVHTRGSVFLQGLHDVVL